MILWSYGSPWQLFPEPIKSSVPVYPGDRALFQTDGRILLLFTSAPLRVQLTNSPSHVASAWLVMRAWNTTHPNVFELFNWWDAFLISVVLRNVLGDQRLTLRSTTVHPASLFFCKIVDATKKQNFLDCGSGWFGPEMVSESFQGGVHGSQFVFLPRGDVTDSAYSTSCKNVVLGFTAS